MPIYYPRPRVVQPITWNGSGWEYNGVVVTAVPVEILPGDRPLFIGNPGGSLPGWAPVNAVWTQG